jgi:hypothetical protein
MAKAYTNFGSLDIAAETPKAVLICWRNREVWLPKSQVRFVEVTQGPFAGTTDIYIANWLAAQNRMLY